MNGYLGEEMVESGSNRLFRVISENQGLSVQQISEKLGWTKSKTNRMLSVLERKKWIIKRVFSAAQPRMVVKQDEGVQLLSDKLRRLVAWKDKLQTREKELFGKCVSAQMEGDSETARMYANQCAEVRKIIRLVAGVEAALSKLSSPGGIS
ncbi:MAG TPA: MarR family transcriptional regulator [Candidatus Dormibacteraeota bacterium]|nr:MarR family transcriptional regulator [Candidatus Dormibacteraeota bacterium]